LCLAAPNLPADDNEPGGDADAGLQPHPRPRAEALDHCDRRQSRPDSALGVVLVRQWIAEIDEYSVAHVPGDEPLKALHSVGHSVAIRPDHVAQILRVETGRKTCRANEIAEHHRQLTALGLGVIGQFAQAMIAGEMANNRFAIQTDKPNVKVSWQVTGIRQDAYANAHRIPVEEVKPDKERGMYLHPELFGAPEEKSITAARHPGLMKLAKEGKSKFTGQTRP
jgi:hypothetical protein